MFGNFKECGFLLITMVNTFRNNHFAAIASDQPSLEVRSSLSPLTRRFLIQIIAMAIVWQSVASGLHFNVLDLAKHLTS